MITLLDRVYLSVRWFEAFGRELCRHHSRGAVGPRVFYGHDALPGRGEIAGGGIIKCQDLQTIFPHSAENANILYLVNSALPIHAALIAWFAMRRGMRFVLNQNGVAYKAWYGRGWEEANRPNSYLMTRAEHVFYQSEFSKKGADRFVGTPRGSWEILYNPVDSTVFTPAATPPHPEPLTLLIAGSHYQFGRVQSAVDCLGELVARGRKVRLVIAGRCAWRREAGRSEAEIEEYIRQRDLGPHVQMRGPYAQTEAPALFRSAHVLLHTKYNDPCPRLVVEAMACGLPVVYSASGGTPELVGNEAGAGIPAPLDWEELHIPSGRELADAVQIVAARLDVYAKSARNRAVAKFGLPAWLERHRVIFEKLAIEKGSNGSVM